MINPYFVSKNEGFYNARIKYYFDENNAKVPYEIAVADKHIFSDGGLEESEFSKAVNWKLEELEASREIFCGDSERVFKPQYISEPCGPKENLRRSWARARTKIFDYCMCNDFDLFVTLTLDSKSVTRFDYSSVIKKLNTWLNNRVTRCGLRYLGVPELHKNGGIHFHFLMNDVFRLVDSGCVSCDGRKKPIKVTTADRLKIPCEQRHTVYNIPEWKIGFSTAIRVYGGRSVLARYITKEFCKSAQKLGSGGALAKIGGRWYYNGGGLKKPALEWQNIDFSGFVYSREVDTGYSKIRYWQKPLSEK